MAVEPRVTTTATEYRALQRRVEALERLATKGSVDVEARQAAEAATGVATAKNRVWRQDEAPVDDGTFMTGDIWFDTNDKNAPYVWQRVSGQVTTSGATPKQGVVTTAGATGKLQKVTLAAATAYYATVKVRRKSGAAVFFDVKDETNNITVTAERSAAEDNWLELGLQITTGAATPTLMFAVRADAADPAASVFLVDALTLTVPPAETNLIPNGGFEGGLSAWTTTGALVNPGATLVFDRTDSWSGAWVSAQDTAFLEASGNKIFRQPGPPDPAVVGPLKEGDLWFDTDDANKPYNYRSGAWVTVRDATISYAQATADGKNKIFVLGYAPYLSGGTVGDTWIDTSNHNVIKNWNGSAWTTQKLGENAISGVAATVVTGQLIAGQIATGEILAGHIRAENVTANALHADAMTAKNFYTDIKGSGHNRICMGPLSYVTEPRIVFDTTGLGPSSLSPSIRGASTTQNTGMIIHSGTVGTAPNHTETSISMGSSSSQPDRIIMAARTGGKTVTAELDASINRFYCSGDIQPGNLSWLKFDSASFNVAPVGYAPNLWVGGGSESFPYAIRRCSPAALATHTHTSARRYKRDIGLIEADELDPRRLLRLPVRQFRFISHDDPRLPEDAPPDERLHPGFIAEEVEEIYPIAAFYNGDGVINDYIERKLVPGMLALIQQLHARVTTLEER